MNERQIRVIAEAIAREGRAMGLTGRHSPEEVMAKDLPDAVAVADQVEEWRRNDPSFAASRPARLMDLGTGAGLPGLLVAALLPNESVDLFDRKATSGAFITPLAMSAGLGNARFVSPPVPPYDAITVRAVGSFETIVKDCLAWLGDGGRLVLLVGSDAESVRRRAESAGAKVVSERPYELPTGEKRSLLIAQKP